MTVCIAGINRSGSQPTIIAATDRSISFYGGYFAAEGVAMKIERVNDDWAVMFAGSNSPLVALVDAIKENAQQAGTSGFRQFALLCSKTYKAERKNVIENEILADFDIENYAEFLSLRESDPKFFSTIDEKIKEKEENWNLLFAGFDQKQTPHIFVIAERGKIQYCDLEGFAAIGSGAMRALVSLSSHPFKGDLPIDEAIFAVMSAKFSAESADGVGDDTIVALLEPRQATVPVLTDYLLEMARYKWGALPRYPAKEMKDVITRDINGVKGVIREMKNPKGFTSATVLYGLSDKAKRKLNKRKRGHT